MRTKRFGLIFKKVLRYSPSEKKYRLFRIIYNSKDLRESKILGEWRSICFQVALMPKIFYWEKGMARSKDWRIIIAFLSLHLKVQAGGYSC